MTSKIYAALSKAQSQIRGALKESTNPHFRSRYADLESVIDAIRQPLADNELSFTQSVSDGYIHTTIFHADGGTIVGLVPFVGQFADMQKVGAALTYARRQGICTAFGVPQVDDDGNTAAAIPTAPVAKPAAKPVAKKQETVAPGLLTDGRMDEKDYAPANAKPSVPFKVEPKEETPITDKAKLDLERYGLEVEVKEIYPLFVENRDNELVKQICRDEKIPMSKLQTHGAALKKYCAETREHATLSDAVVEFFTNNK